MLPLMYVPCMPCDSHAHVIKRLCTCHVCGPRAYHMVIHRITPCDSHAHVFNVSPCHVTYMPNGDPHAIRMPMCKRAHDYEIMLHHANACAPTGAPHAIRMHIYQRAPLDHPADKENRPNVTHWVTRRSSSPRRRIGPKSIEVERKLRNDVLKEQRRSTTTPRRRQRRRPTKSGKRTASLS